MFNLYLIALFLSVVLCTLFMYTAQGLNVALTAQRYRIRRRIFDTLLKRRIYHRFGSSQFSGMILICILGKECRRDRAGLISARTKEVLRARRASGLPACRTVERPRQKQVGQAPSGNRGAARQRVPPEVHREALQFFACQPRKLAEEAPNQETEAVKSYGGFGTFEPLGPVLPGNVSEAKTLEAALKNLEEVHGCRDPNNRPTVIMDAGVATDDNLKFLKENGYGWICISRKARVAPPDRAPDSTLHTKAKHLVEAWRISDKDADELQLYARSEGRRQTEASILARQRSKLEAELQNLHDGLSLPRRMKRHDRVLEKIGRLKERYSGVASQYKIRIERTGDTATAVRFKRQDKAALADAAAGSCVLRTSHTDWDAEKILRTYWRLTDLENTFRQLKSELGLRPIWHSTDARISAHLFITVLAYHAVHLIRTRLRDNDINLRWDSIRNRMASWERITTTQQTPTGQQVVVRQDARPSDEAATIARHVNVHVGAYR